MKAHAYLENLTECLRRLPGIGRRSAERIAYRLIRDPEGLLSALVHALKDLRDHVRLCPQCGNLMAAEEDRCRLCTDPRRDGAVLCVVEDPDDIQALEKSGGYHGRYHALFGKISPMHGTGPADLRIAALLSRIAVEGIEEVVLALNTNVESDATAGYLAEILRTRNVRTTRLAFGLPAGSGIAYSDSVTLARALKGRQTI